MIRSLALTVFIESLVLAGYSAWQKKPLAPLLLSGLVVNFFTQTLLWFGLNEFRDRYLLTLSIAEFCIWWIEALGLHLVPQNHLNFRSALVLSLVMNLSSFSIGWFLPV